MLLLFHQCMALVDLRAPFRGCWLELFALTAVQVGRRAALVDAAGPEASMCSNGEGLRRLSLDALELPQDGCS
jgi:hypothetical protein